MNHIHKKLFENQLKMVQPHQFWDNEPVWKMFSDQPKNDGPIVQKSVKDISTDEISLPNGFEWTQVDITDPDTMQRLYELLRDHYVEDDDNQFRFDYPIEFLQWTLKMPNYKPEWHLGIQSAKDKKLLGFISGTPLKLTVNE